eukprot:scaffold1027_cov116-Isochrysis_galbana.AAC.1
MNSTVPAPTYPTALAARTAAAPSSSLSACPTPGAGASSSTFWCRRCTEQSRSNRWTAPPRLSQNTCVGKGGAAAVSEHPSITHQTGPLHGAHRGRGRHLGTGRGVAGGPGPVDCRRSRPRLFFFSRRGASTRSGGAASIPCAYGLLTCTSMCRAASRYRSRRSRASPKEARASRCADATAPASSDCLRTIRMPLPPPPSTALSRTGEPSMRPHRSASAARGNASCLHQALGRVLGAHRPHRRAGGADERQAGGDDRVGEVGILGEEAVPRVDGLGARPARHVEYPVASQVRVGRRRPANAMCLVRHAHVQRVGVGL